MTAQNIKFGIFPLPNFQSFPESENLPFDLSDGVMVYAGPLKGSLKADSIKHWATWLGSIEWDANSTRRVYLQTIQDANADEKKIQSLLHDAYLSLMICAPLRTQSEGPLLMNGTGSFENGKLNAEFIQTISRYKQWIESHYMSSRGYHGKRSRFLEDLNLLKEWKNVFQKLQKFKKRKKGTEAINLAIESLRNGLEVSYVDFRIPYFVRTCESIMAPKRNETRSKFISRAASLLKQPPLPLFISRKTDIEKLLGDIFDIRNGAVHGMPFGWKVSKRVKSKRRMEQYAYLAEECARRALKFALGNKDLISPA